MKGRLDPERSRGRDAGRASRGRAAPLQPRAVVEAMNRVLPPETLIYCDIGNVTAWCVHHLARTRPGTFHTDTVYGAMDYAIPAAIGGKRAVPDAPVCAVVGDGGALMGSVLDVFTAVEHQIPICVVVFNDGGWGMLEQGVGESPFRHAPRPSFRFQRRVDFAALARALHARGILVRTTPELERGLLACIDARRVTVLDVHVDPLAKAPTGGRIRHVNRHMGEGA